ncbi:hypothetical protein LCGC14_2836220 [marine sediment metagenome]|uniref:Uncharacterized protein n=2 Tax=marine sediment metagenome TaxID=412755 RepID=A0A0F9B3M7_9ZZZZ
MEIKGLIEKTQAELNELAQQIQQLQQKQQVLVNEALKKQGALELLQEMEKDEV